MASSEPLFPSHFVNGVCLPTEVTKQHLLEIKKMTLDPTDIFVVGYPKSGQTWLMTALKAIFHADDLEAMAGMRTADGFLDFSFEEALDEPKVEGIPNIFRSCLRPSMLPEEITKKNIKIIHIKRNPKDVVVSCYHFTKMFTLTYYQGSWETYFQAFMDGLTPFGSWFDYIKEWWGCKNNLNILFIDYEELLTDTPRLISTLAEFVGKSITPDQINQICDIISFDSMKSNPNMNRMHIKRYDASKGQFLRSGKVGDWKNHFTEEQENIFGITYTNFVEETGLKFEFE